MSSVEYTSECPRCGEPNAWSYSVLRTYEDIISCHRCGFYKSNTLIPEFWGLAGKEQCQVDFNDEKWWIRKDEISIVGGASINLKIDKAISFTFMSQQELESFKLDYKAEINNPISRIKVGQNFLFQFIEKEVVFRVTNLDTMTTRDYRPKDYFEAFPLDYNDR